MWGFMWGFTLSPALCLEFYCSMLPVCKLYRENGGHYDMDEVGLKRLANCRYPDRCQSAEKQMQCRPSPRRYRKPIKITNGLVKSCA